MVKKLVKILMWTGISLVTTVVLVYIAIRIFFPAEKLKQILISQLESKINRQVSIDQLWLNPFTGVALDSLVCYDLSPKDTSVMDTAIFFSAKKIHLRYRFFPLLKREIEISDILIDRPEINLTQDPRGKWNFDDLITMFMAETTAVSPDTGAMEFSLPLTLKLKKFYFNNFITNVVINQGETLYTIRSGGLSLQVDDLFLPRDTFEDIKQNANVDLQISSHQQPWQFVMKTKSPPETIEISTELQLKTAISIAGLKKIESQGNLALANFLLTTAKEGGLAPRQYQFPLPHLASVSFELSGNAEDGVVFLKKFTALIGEENIFDLNGMVDDVLNQPEVDLQIINSNVRLHSLFDLFSPLLPDTFQDQLKNLSLRGWISLRGTTIQGKPLSENLDDALSFNVLLSVNDVEAKYTEPATQVKDLKINTKISGIYNLNGLQKTDIWMGMTLDTLSVTVDTMRFNFGGLDLNLRSTLNAEFLPDSITAAFVINQFFNVPLNFIFNFKSIDRFNKYRATGNLLCNQLSLKKLPDLMMDGKVDFALDLNSEALDQIDLNLKLVSNDIDLQTETGLLTIKPIKVSGKAMLATDTMFQKIDLRQLSLKVNDFASALMHGNFVMGKQQELTLVLDQAEIDHSRAMKIVPAQLLEGYESLKISGQTGITSRISVTFTEDLATIINIDGKADIQAGILYPDLFLTLGRVDGQLNFQTNGESGTIDLAALLDSLVLEGVRDLPLRHISLFMKGRLPDFETFQIDTSQMIIPDLMTQVFMTARIDSLSGNVKTNVKGHLSFNTEDDSVTLINRLIVSGKMSQQIELDLLGDTATVTGKLVVENLSAKYEDLADVDSIMGVINFAEKFDIEKESLIKNPSSQSFIADAGSYYYDLLRPYYQQSRDKFSHLRISKVKVMDYFATEINFDLLILNERIEVPRFSLKAYDGNMAGLLYANLHEGKPDQIEWKVKANVSRLNSAKLIPSQRVKEKGSDLNLNLELFGTGIDPEGQFDIGGYFYVTKIGPGFTDNVLRSLDPKSTDKSIQDTRRLLNWGYKPRLISVEIKHGNLYPTIHLVKAKLLTRLIPLNLSGGKIELARIPIKFFLMNMMAETE